MSWRTKHKTSSVNVETSHRLLISGLCLQGNKGGPALALSIIEVLLAQNPEISPVMLISNGSDFELESNWAAHYGINIVADPLPRDFRALLRPAQSRRALRLFVDLFAAFRHSDAHLSMTGVAYVGPPIGAQRFASAWSRFRLMALAKFTRTPFVGWTQSYGPFGSRLVRFLAKLDLRSQREIYCRGADSRDAVLGLLPNATVTVFPDVAFALPFERTNGTSLLAESVDQAPSGRPVVTISPSAVSFQKCSSTKESDALIAFYTAMCDRLDHAGFQPLLLPHTVRPQIDDPAICDAALCRRIRQQRPSTPMVTEDLCVTDIKSILSCADVHVGARYHSLVGALGSGTPAVSLSWHPKYKDLMESFGLDDEVFELDEPSDALAYQVVDSVVALSRRRCTLSPDLLTIVERFQNEVIENAWKVAGDLGIGARHES